MELSLKSLGTEFKRSDVALAFRNLFDIKPVYYQKVPLGSSCSDLFMWLASDEWSTTFDAMNITSLCFPDIKDTERVSLILFKQDGSYGGEVQDDVSPLTAKSFDVSATARELNLGSCGGFVVLRRLSRGNMFERLGTCLSERGYVGYSSKQSSLKQYVHGNSYVLCSHPGQQKGYDFVRSNFIYDKIYRVQTPLNDCRRAKCHFLNPSAKRQHVKLIGYDDSGTAKWNSNFDFNGLAVHSVDVPQNIARVEAVSKVFMLRPVVQKIYDTGSDFFHA